MLLGIKRVIRANHMISLITSSTTDPWCSILFQGVGLVKGGDVSITPVMIFSF
jgi:hypothetical protein